MNLKEVKEDAASSISGPRKIVSRSPAGHEEEGGEGRTDPGYALQSFLDRIPITSIPGIRRSPGTCLEINSNDCIKDAISLLYHNSVSGAPLADSVNSDFGKFIDRDIGFINFSSMVLWSLEEFDKEKAELKSRDHGFLSMIEQNPNIGQTKIGELAKSLLWEPFFPVQLDATLFHVLLLFSKHHRLEVVPIIEATNSYTVGFITQSAVVRLLLQSSGLEWFDQIAEKALTEFGFEKDGRMVSAYADQSVADTLHILWEKRIGAIPVVDRNTESMIGCVRCSDVRLLIDNDDLFNNRKKLNVEEFIKLDAQRTEITSPSTEGDIGALISPDICLKNSYLPRMDAPTTNALSDTLKQAMENLVASKTDRSFLVDKLGKLKGVVTLRDIIKQFSPPSMNSTFRGGCFFESVLEQAGCRVEDGSIIQDG